MNRLAALWTPSVAWLAAHRAEVRLAVRVAAAGALTYALAHVLGLKQGYWAVFTAVIVMQASVGGSVKATLDRMIGTLGGAIYGGAIAVLAAHHGAIATGIGLAAALLPLAFIAALDARFRVAPVTAVIVLISPFGSESSPIWFTIDRVGEIALGSIVALAVSLTVLPARAHGVLAARTKQVLDLLGSFLALILGGVHGPVDAAKLRRLQVGTRRILVVIEGAAEEAQRERTVHLTDDPDPEPIARTTQRVRNDIIMMARALAVSLPAPVALALAPFIDAVAREGQTLLASLGEAFLTRIAPPSLGPLQAALRAYHGEISTMRPDPAFAALSPDALGRLFTLGFAFDQFARDVGDLADRAAEFAGQNQRSVADAPPGPAV